MRTAVVGRHASVDQQAREVYAEVAGQGHPRSQSSADQPREFRDRCHRTGTGTVGWGVVLAILRMHRHLRGRGCRFESCRAYHVVVLA
jgi:hypothetical protein